MRSALPWHQNQTKTLKERKLTNNNPIDIDAKRLNKILTNWIQQHKNSNNNKIHHDQVGFIPGVKVWVNIWKLTNVINNAVKEKNVNSVDVEKALDKIHSW